MQETAFFVSEYSGHAGRIAAQLLQKNPSLNRLVVMGGDGTIHDVINALYQGGASHLPAIGIIPSGSSNDFAKSMGIPINLHKACACVLRAQSVLIDIGSSTTGFFMMASSPGAFADIARYSNRLRGLRGGLRYVLATLIVMLTSRPKYEFEIRSERQEWTGRYAIALIANVKRFGGLTLCPTAKATDGLFDCVCVRAMSLFGYVKLLFYSLKHDLSSHPAVTAFQCQTLSIQSNTAFWVNHDGEVSDMKVERMTYSVHPQKLSIICCPRV